MSSNDFPYKEFIDSKTWQVIEQAVDDLVNNGDVIEQTARKYIVGYIIKKMNDSKLLIDE